MAKSPDPSKDLSDSLAWPTLVLAAACFAGLGLNTVAVLQGERSLILGLLLNTLAIYLAFTPMHDAAHGAISGGRAGRRWLDGVVGWTCGLLFLAPFVGFRRLHLRHHSATNDPRRDPDYWVVSDHGRGVMLRCLTVIPHYYRFFLAAGGFGGAQHNSERSRAIVFLGGLVATIWLLITGGYLHQVMMLWLLPAVLASGILAFTFDWLPHHPHRSRARFKDTRLLRGWGLHWLLVAQDLHLVHHLHPRVPFYRYRKLYRHLRPQLETKGTRIAQLWPGGSGSESAS